MSWGYKILLIYVGFVAMISSFVFIASKQTNEMQDENYYVSELHYQQVINGKNNLAALGLKVRVTDSMGLIKITIPTPVSEKISGGKIYFKRPSDKSKDKTIALAVNENGEQILNTADFSNGLYTVEVSWDRQGKNYFAQQYLFVSK